MILAQDQEGRRCHHVERRAADIGVFASGLRRCTAALRSGHPTGRRARACTAEKSRRPPFARSVSAQAGSSADGVGSYRNPTTLFG